MPARHYLIASPASGLIVRRAHEPAPIREAHLETIEVDRATWDRYRAGDILNGADLPEPALTQWIMACQRTGPGYGQRMRFEAAGTCPECRRQPRGKHKADCSRRPGRGLRLEAEGR